MDSAQTTTKGIVHRAERMGRYSDKMRCKQSLSEFAEQKGIAKERENDTQSTGQRGSGIIHHRAGQQCSERLDLRQIAAIKQS